MQRLLLVEDDERLREMLAEYFSESGFQVDGVARGDQAIDRILTTTPDLVILDMMLPGLNGIGVLHAVRHRYPGQILMMTARRGDLDQVGGLEAGADDYVIKPCKPRVLLARVRALMRRSQRRAEPKTPDDRLQRGQLVVDRGLRKVLINGTPQAMTTTEFELLWSLASRSGEVVSRDVLFTEVRGVPYDGQDRSIDIHISRLRKKLSRAGLHHPSIVAVRGEGYQLTRAEER
ncbi:MAG: response regulator transcription factor [Myxococcota bacterium]